MQYSPREDTLTHLHAMNRPYSREMGIDTGDQSPPIQSHWATIARAIMTSAREQRPLTIAKNMDTFVNHDLLFKKIETILRKGQKPSKENLKKDILIE